MSARGAQACEQAHSVVIEGTRIDLVLRRSARRSFALQVDHRGARVAVPLRTALSEVDRFVLGHGRWLLDRLQAQAARPPVAAIEVVEGARIPLLGGTFTLRLRKGRGVRWTGGPDGGEELHLSPSVDPARGVLRALQSRALGCF